MRLSRLSNLPLLGVYHFPLTNFSPMCRVDTVRFDHIRGLFITLSFFLVSGDNS